MRTKKPDRPSLELDDYSGPCQPDLHLSDFSKEGLMKLVEIGGSIYGTVNRLWYQAARDVAEGPWPVGELARRIGEKPAAPSTL